MIRPLILAASALALAACSTTPSNNPYGANGPIQSQTDSSTYNQSEMTEAIAGYFGTTSEAAASVVERLFREQGQPVGYITGEEASGAVSVGLRYGKGMLWMKDGTSREVYWQGPSVGWDIGANGSKVFTLVYNLDNPEFIYQRFPGVEGSAYLIGGLGVNYQRSNEVTLAPIRSGAGLRLGANVGYLAYSKKRQWIPL